MSRATELASKFGHEFVSGLIAFYPAELEAFYHAARAEALGEASTLAYDYTSIGAFREELRSIADREGK